MYKSTPDEADRVSPRFVHQLLLQTTEHDNKHVARTLRSATLDFVYVICCYAMTCGELLCDAKSHTTVLQLNGPPLPYLFAIPKVVFHLPLIIRSMVLRYSGPIALIT